MTSDLGRYLAQARTDDLLRLARQRQAALPEADATGCAAYARRRRWIRRLRIALFPGARRVVRHA